MLTNRAVAERTEELLKSLRDNGIEPAGEPMGWFYDRRGRCRSCAATRSS